MHILNYFSGGRQGSIDSDYAEALFIKYPAKGNRNETAGKKLIGRKDSIISRRGEESGFYNTLLSEPIAMYK